MTSVRSAQDRRLLGRAAFLDGRLGRRRVGPPALTRDTRQFLDELVERVGSAIEHCERREGYGELAALLSEVGHEAMNILEEHR